jgi:hypothetical protein
MAKNTNCLNAPWKSLDGEDHADFGGYVVLDAGGRMVADCNIFHPDGRDNDPANRTRARLIAAAPDLLAACKAVLAIAGDGGNPAPVLRKLETAIAKAEKS